jgi:protein gp37
MSDLFQKEVPEKYIEVVCRVMQQVDWHVYQVLTKRSERLRDLLSGELKWEGQCEHILWGVSVENRKHGLPRIEHLRQTPARLRFLSVEPLIEDLGEIDLTGIHWVIVGGESGPGARPMDAGWVISIREQCKAANVPFFFKQWGGVRKKQTGRLLQGRTYDEMPQVQTGTVALAKDRKAVVSEIETMAQNYISRNVTN